MHHGTWALLLCSALLTTPGIAHEAVPAKSKAPQRSALPKRKPGLWEVTVRSEGLVLSPQGQAKPQPQTVQMCTNAQSEPVMLFAIVAGQENCSEVRSQRRSRQAGGGYALQTVCHVHGTRVDTQMELQGDLQSAYSGAFETKVPANPMANKGRMAFEGRWLGECTAGQRPGDMRLPNGITVNVVDDRKRVEKGHDHGEHGHAH